MNEFLSPIDGSAIGSRSVRLVPEPWQMRQKNGGRAQRANAHVGKIL